jgi:glycosyltransferase involved in cell wall biosynthesis
VTADGMSSTLVFIGATRGAYHEIDPEMAARLRQDAEQRGLAGRVKFVERTEAIEDYYRAADVFVLPTTREGLPNVLLEAMASGVPPVITRLAGVTDWLFEDGVHGRLVASGDDEALASALRELLADPDRRLAMGRAARDHVVAHFGSDVTAAKTLAIYRELNAPVTVGGVRA